MNSSKLLSFQHCRSKMASTEVCDKFYEVLRLQCLKHRMTPPIILYGRLFEEEQFQYVAVSLPLFDVSISTLNESINIFLVRIWKTGLHH